VNCTGGNLYCGIKVLDTVLKKFILEYKGREVPLMDPVGGFTEKKAGFHYLMEGEKPVGVE